MIEFTIRELLANALGACVAGYLLFLVAKVDESKLTVKNIKLLHAILFGLLWFILFPLMKRLLDYAFTSIM